jgi:hypothetical protein
MLVVLLPGLLAAADKNKEAQIKALKQQIQQLRQQEPAQLRQIDEQFRQTIANLANVEAQQKRQRARLENEERVALKRIDERFDHILHNLAPKHVHAQLETALKTTHIAKQALEQGDWDFGGNRAAARRSLGAADRQLEWTLAHDTHEERVKAARDLEAAHVDLDKALAYVATKFASGGMPPGQLVATQQLTEAIPIIDNTHHLLRYVDHEIKDFDHEKRELLKRRDAEKHKVHEAFAAKIKQLGAEVHNDEATKKQLEIKKNEVKSRVKAQIAAKIRELERQIRELEKKK